MYILHTAEGKKTKHWLEIPSPNMFGPKMPNTFAGQTCHKNQGTHTYLMYNSIHTYMYISNIIKHLCINAYVITIDYLYLYIYIPQVCLALRLLVHLGIPNFIAKAEPLSVACSSTMDLALSYGDAMECFNVN